MKKSELKVGQKVVLRDGGEYLYIPIFRGDFTKIDADDTLDIYSNLNLEWYNEDLIDNDEDEDNDIMSVYSCTSFSTLLSDLSKVNWNLVWEREEVEKITADEAMKRLEEQSGKKVKIVRD